MTTAWHSPFNFASLEWDDSAWDDGVDWPAVDEAWPLSKDDDQ